jgi:flagellar operon protein
MKGIGPSLTNVNPAATGAVDSTRQPNTRGVGADNSVFRDQLSALQNVMPSTSNPSAATSPLKFSNHAIDRMQARGIHFSPEELLRIEGAVNKAAAKGAKDTLLLTDASALIVSVKDKTVVTVMDKAQLKDNVFTNIDSTVMI